MWALISSHLSIPEPARGYRGRSMHPRITYDQHCMGPGPASLRTSFCLFLGTSVTFAAAQMSSVSVQCETACCATWTPLLTLLRPRFRAAGPLSEDLRVQRHRHIRETHYWTRRHRLPVTIGILCTCKISLDATCSRQFPPSLLRAALVPH